LLQNFQHPEIPTRGSIAGHRPIPFRGAGGENRTGQRHSHFTAPTIVKYIADLQLLGLL
jgi:hypothetical protein